jgi:hypothetical protein
MTQDVSELSGIVKPARCDERILLKRQRQVEPACIAFNPGLAAHRLDKLASPA